MSPFTAMVEGVKISEPLEGWFFSDRHGVQTCAVGCMVLGKIGLNEVQRIERKFKDMGASLYWRERAESLFPILTKFLPARYSECKGCQERQVLDLAVHLNDYHHLSRLQVGRWLERLENRFQAKPSKFEASKSLLGQI